jgi:hypothetical protein
VDALTCVFCNEIESCQHLVFECAIASHIWEEVRKVLDLQPQTMSMNVVSALWRDKKNHVLINMINVAILRSIWITRNDMVFN